MLITQVTLNYFRIMLCVPALAVSGCRSTYIVTTINDPGSNATIDRAVGNWLQGGQLSQTISLNLERITTGDGKRAFNFVVEYVNENWVSKEWLQIEPGQTLTLVVDGVRLRFSGPGGAGSREKTEQGPTETARYRVSIDQLKMIAGAKDVIVVVRGTGGAAEKFFDEQNFDFLRKFLADFGQFGEER